jgi:hypothetical protein
MTFTLKQVVPWGRSFDEYQRMFAFTKEDSNSKILGCGDGPASFNAEATGYGYHVVSCDPIYQFTEDQIRSRINETSSLILDETRKNQSEFIWNTIKTVEELGSIRMNAMNTFLSDYNHGKAEGQYVAAELRMLPFIDSTFD